MHSGGELLANSDNNVAKNCRTLGIDLDRNDFLICNAKFCCCLGCEVDVTLCSDNALCKNVFCTCFRVYKLAALCSCDIATLTDKSANTDGTSVCKRKLNLACRTCRTKDGCLDAALRANNCKLFSACILTGLAEILFLGKLIACAKESVNCFSGEMNVSCRCFY